MKFKVGDKVKVIKRYGGHDLEIGKVYKIENIFYDEYENKQRIKIDDWSLYENEIELVSVCDLSLKEIFDLWDNGDETIEDKLEGAIDFWELETLLKKEIAIQNETKVKIVNTNTCWDGFYGKVYCYDEYDKKKPYMISIPKTDYSDEVYLYMNKNNLEVIDNDN